MNRTRKLVVTMLFFIAALLSTHWAVSDLAARQSPANAPAKTLTSKRQQGSLTKPNSSQKTPNQLEAELDEILEIRKRLGGGVAEQLKGLNIQMNPGKAKKTIEEDSPEFRELLREQSASQQQEPLPLGLVIPSGHKLVSFKIDPKDAMPGILDSGEVVDLVRFQGPAAETFLRKIPVFATQGAGNVGLLMSDAQADQLDTARKSGRICLALKDGNLVPESSSAKMTDPAEKADPEKADPELAKDELQRNLNPQHSTPQPVPFAPRPRLVGPNLPGFGQIPTPAVPLGGFNQMQPNGPHNQSGLSRTRQAARMVEQAAAELEESGQYELADELRKNAQKIWESAR